MTKTAKNQKIINAAKVITKAMEAEIEDILCEAESLVKSYFPAKYVKAALKEVEKQLDDNGLEVKFDTTVSRETLSKTASLKATGRELHEAIKHIASATVDEFEDMLADANEVANRTLTRFASSERPEVEAKLKNMIEGRMHNCGVYCRFDRVTYDPQASIKKALAAVRGSKKVAMRTNNRILDAMSRDA